MPSNMQSLNGSDGTIQPDDGADANKDGKPDGVAPPAAPAAKPAAPANNGGK
jgi:hypothetical protein